MDNELETVSVRALVEELCRRSDAIVIGRLVLKRRGGQVCEEFTPIAKGATHACIGIVHSLGVMMKKHAAKTFKRMEGDDEES